ncbi:MAG: porin family protein [Prevotellaceae bacterium]|jgi:outer membrane protein W|nr:porin family protein [Prevotellaceae bacterium]
MRKLVLIAVLAAGTLNFVSAQESYKPSAGNFTLEAGFSPFSVEGDIIDAAALSGFYHFSDNLALRLGLGFNYGSSFWKNGETGDAAAQQTNSSFEFSITPGIVYYFGGTSRLAPYVSAGLGIGYTTISAKDEDGTITAKMSSIAGSYFTFGVGLSAGFNYFIAEHLYLGAELGVQFFNVSIPNEKTVTSGENAPPSPPESKHKQGGMNIGITATPQLRLGWTF